MILTSLVTWALVAVSLFNTILLLWLGITLWLNANRRDLGVAVIAFGFLLGSAFFVAHAALLLSDTWQLTRSTTLWLAVAMTPIALLPYVWYVVLLRYCGYWVERAGNLRRRHRPWVALMALVLLIGLGCLALLGIPYVPVLAFADAVGVVVARAGENRGLRYPAGSPGLSALRVGLCPAVAGCFAPAGRQ